MKITKKETLNKKIIIVSYDFNSKSPFLNKVLKENMKVPHFNRQRTNLEITKLP